MWDWAIWAAVVVAVPAGTTAPALLARDALAEARLSVGRVTAFLPRP
jgi:hypothetical protein